MKNSYRIKFSNATDAYFLLSGIPVTLIARGTNPGQALRSFMRAQGIPESWVRKYAPATDDTETDRCLMGFGACHRNVWAEAVVISTPTCTFDPNHDCPKCGETTFSHNDDGSCVTEVK